MSATLGELCALGVRKLVPHAPVSIQRAEEPDQMVDVLVDRDSQVFATDLDRRAIHLDCERGVLEFLPDRSAFHLGVPNRIQFPVRVEYPADLITGEQSCRKPGLR